MLVVVRMRGEIGTRKEVLDTFRILGLKKVYSAVLVEENPVTLGMIRKVRNFAAWGEASEETVNILEKTRNLKPPRGGMKSKKVAFPKGNLGYCGEKINDMVRRMA